MKQPSAQQVIFKVTQAVLVRNDGNRITADLANGLAHSIALEVAAALVQVDKQLKEAVENAAQAAIPPADSQQG